MAAGGFWALEAVELPEASLRPLPGPPGGLAGR
jgi:hypothetical protein